MLLEKMGSLGANHKPSETNVIILAPNLFRRWLDKKFIIITKIMKGYLTRNPHIYLEEGQLK